MEYIYYLIPGIISYSIYSRMDISVPEESRQFNLIMNYIMVTILSVVSSIYLLISIQDNISWGDKLSTILKYDFTDLTILRIGSISIFAIIAPIVILFLYNHITARVFMKGKNGSITFTKDFKRNIIVKYRVYRNWTILKYAYYYLMLIFNFQKANKPNMTIIYFDHDTAYKKGLCNWVKRIITLSLLTKTKVFMKPVIVIKGVNKIGQGQLVSYYGTPWNYKDLLFDTQEDFTEEFKCEASYTYYDVKEDLTFKIYEMIYKEDKDE